MAEYLLKAFAPVLDELVALVTTALLVVATAWLKKQITRLGFENEAKKLDIEARKNTSAILYAEEVSASAKKDEPMSPAATLELAVEHKIEASKPAWLSRLFSQRPDRATIEAGILAQLPKLSLGAAVKDNKPLIAALHDQSQPEAKP